MGGGVRVCVCGADGVKTDGMLVTMSYHIISCHIMSYGVGKVRDRI
jgi:hypothetical protein